MARLSSLCLAGTILLAAAAPARADITGFLGANTTPANRQVLGGAIGFGLLVIGGEFEYAFTPDDPAARAPSLKTGTGNLVLQTPVPIFGFQPYFTTGGGVYQEKLNASSETQFVANVGGGVKWKLAGPLRVRVDYRVFRLHGDALYDTVHRFYVGANLNF